MALPRAAVAPSPYRIWHFSVAAAVLVFVVHFALVTAIQYDAALLGTVGDLLVLLEDLAAMLAIGLLAKRAGKMRGRDRLAWTFLATALLANSLGQAAWWIIQTSQGEVPFPSLADPLYLAFYPFAAIGLALLPAFPNPPRDRFRISLDIASALLAGILAFWAFAIGPAVSAVRTSRLELATAVAYPAGDLAMLAALLLLLNRRVAPENRPPLKLLASGAVVMLVADSLFSYEMLKDTYISGGYSDLGYTLMNIFFVLAVVRQMMLWSPGRNADDVRLQDNPARVRIVTWSAALPYAAVLLAFGLLIWDHLHPTGVPFPMLAAILGSIILLLSARQLLALSENNALHKAQLDLTARLLQAQHELELRVDQRTSELQNANAALEAEVIQHEESEKHLHSSLKEKEVLLKEINHRVKNNLQVVSSLLALQGRTSPNRPLSDVLLEGQARIRAMALIHEKLYGSSDLARIDFGDYLRSLVADLFDTYRVNSAAVSLRLDVISIWLSIDTAVPCGLIVNEFVSNSLKHAFPNARHGTVSVQLSPVDGGRLRLSVMDDGIGMDPNIDIRKAKSLGLQLAVALIRQIDGELELESSQGTRFHITFVPQEG